MLTPNLIPRFPTALALLALLVSSGCDSSPPPNSRVPTSRLQTAEGAEHRGSYLNLSPLTDVVEIPGGVERMVEAGRAFASRLTVSGHALGDGGILYGEPSGDYVVVPLVPDVPVETDGSVRIDRYVVVALGPDSEPVSAEVAEVASPPVLIAHGSTVFADDGPRKVTRYGLDDFNAEMAAR